MDRQVHYGQGKRLEPLVSCKGGNCEVTSEGSETTKLGTDEQEPDMRLLGWMSKHIIVKSETHLSECRSSRSGRNRVKPARLVQAGKMSLPGEVSKVTCS